MHTIGNAIRELRKALKLNQSDFASRIGSVQNTITGYETGRREPSNQVITLICREFNVNEDWLRTGKGEMFAPVNRDKEIEVFMDTVMKSESADFRRRLVSVLSKLNPAEWKLLEGMATKLAEEAEAEKAVPQKLHIVKRVGRDGSYEELKLTDEEYAHYIQNADDHRKAPDDL